MYTTDEKRLAEKLLDHSVELKSGEKILIQSIGFNAVGLVRALVELTRAREAHPFVQIEDPEINRILLEAGAESFWETQAEVDQLPLMKQMDAFIGIRGSENIYENSSVSPILP